jgi:hypothetical protein
MKSKEEIEQLASKRFIIKQFIGEDDYNRNETIAARCGYVEGYTQCQEDMAKEIQSLKEQIRLKDASLSELSKNYGELLFKLNLLD